MPVSSAFYDDNISYFDDVSVPGQSSSNAVSLPSTDGNCFPLFDSLNAAALKLLTKEDDEIALDVTTRAWDALFASKNAWSGSMGDLVAKPKDFVPTESNSVHQCVVQTISAQVMSTAEEFLIPVGRTAHTGTDGVCRMADASFIVHPKYATEVYSYTKSAANHVSLALVLEVDTSARQDSYASQDGTLRAKAQEWFSHYPSVKYVLLVYVPRSIKMPKALSQMDVELWERDSVIAGKQTGSRLDFRREDVCLSLSTTMLIGKSSQNMPDTIQLDMKRVRNNAMLVV